MFEKLDELIMAGTGAISMTREKAEKIYDDYVSRGKAEKENKTGFVKEMVDRAETNRKNLEQLINDQVRKVIDELNLATKEDIARLETKIDQLFMKE